MDLHASGNGLVIAVAVFAIAFCGSFGVYLAKFILTEWHVKRMNAACGMLCDDCEEEIN